MPCHLPPGELLRCAARPPVLKPLQMLLLQGGGWFGIFVGGLAWYIAAADIINESYKRVGVGSSVGANAVVALRAQIAAQQPLGAACTSSSACTAGGAPVCFAKPSSCAYPGPATLQTVLPIGKWNVGVPMFKVFKRVFGWIPVIGWFYVKACNREDRLAGESWVDSWVREQLVHSSQRLQSC